MTVRISEVGANSLDRVNKILAGIPGASESNPLGPAKGGGYCQNQIWAVRGSRIHHQKTTSCPTCTRRHISAPMGEALCP